MKRYMFIVNKCLCYHCHIKTKLINMYMFSFLFRISLCLWIVINVNLAYNAGQNNEIDVHVLLQKLKDVTVACADISLMREEIHRLNSEVETLKKENAVLASQRLHKQDANDKPMTIPDDENNYMEEKQKRLLIGDANTDTVAFTAILNHSVALGASQAIQYDKVITNIGNAYDPSHGHMITPIKGVYLISTTVFGSNTDDDYLEIAKNGNILVNLYTEGNGFSPMSQTIVVSLEKGDVVWVRNHAGYGNHHLFGGHPYNTFTGYLLKTL